MAVPWVVLCIAVGMTVTPPDTRSHHGNLQAQASSAHKRALSFLRSAPSVALDGSVVRYASAVIIDSTDSLTISGFFEQASPDTATTL
ncbi:hypothetical protein B0H21DRAFT_736379 [Amylocystis lapponica]|nr:hypothetical protein B0H21DRAFT_736379 [Amylocystis lapponica]